MSTPSIPDLPSPPRRLVDAAKTERTRRKACHGTWTACTEACTEACTPKPAHALDRTTGSSIAWCVCGEGFSGDRPLERLAAHIEAPDPNSLGAALIGYLK